MSMEWLECLFNVYYLTYSQIHIISFRKWRANFFFLVLCLGAKKCDIFFEQYKRSLHWRRRKSHKRFGDFFLCSRPLDQKRAVGFADDRLPSNIFFSRLLSLLPKPFFVSFVLRNFYAACIHASDPCPRPCPTKAATWVPRGGGLPIADGHVSFSGSHMG